MLRLQTILHPTDFSAHSEHAFHLACSLARDHGGRVIVMHVTVPHDTVVGEFGMLPPAPEDDREQLQGKLEQLQAPDPAVPVECRLFEGDPTRQILAAASENNCDLIVMGTHGHTAVHDALLGSVAAEVVRLAPCAVLTVRASLPQIP